MFQENMQISIHVISMWCLKIRDCASVYCFTCYWRIDVKHVEVKHTFIKEDALLESW